MYMRLRRFDVKHTLIYSLVIFLLGLLVGGLLLSKSQPRSVFALTKCKNCLHPNEITGLLVSATIAHVPNLIPLVALETDKSIAIEHPAPKTAKHFVIFPKKDIKNLGDTQEADREFMLDMLAVTTQLVREKQMSNYRMWSNGPKTQLIGYLHFHLTGD